MHVEDPHQLISILARIEKGGFLLIDEIHALGNACAEALYTALEDGLVEVVVRDRARARVLRIRLEPFTLVGATTRLGALSEPFRARFKLKETLEPYGEEELSETVLRAAKRLGAAATAEAARAVARRSRGTPREAIRLLERARDLAQVAATGSGVSTWPTWSTRRGVSGSMSEAFPGKTGPWCGSSSSEGCRWAWRVFGLRRELWRTVAPSRTPGRTPSLWDPRAPASASFRVS